MRAMEFQAIDNVLGDLKFFAIFEKEIRTKIYKIG